MAKFMTPKTYNKLRAGNSAWRCLIWFRHGTPYVDIEHVILSGTKVLHYFSGEYGRRYRRGSLRVGPRFLSDVGHCSFDTYRKAKKYQAEVAAGLHKETVELRYEHLHNYD